MAIEIHHFVITRFNTIPDGEISKRRSERLRLAPLGVSEEWLRKRIRIFERFTLPCMESQTNRDFTWVLLVRGNSPICLTDKIDEWAARCPQIIPFYTSLSVRTAAEEFVRQREVQGECVLTTRCDSDDAVRCDFVEIIQQSAYRLAEAGRPGVIDFDNRWVWYDGSAVSSRIRIYTMFCSLLELSQSVRTVYSRRHTGWRVSCRIQEPCVMTVCHPESITHGRTLSADEWKGKISHANTFCKTAPDGFNK